MICAWMAHFHWYAAARTNCARASSGIHENSCLSQLSQVSQHFEMSVCCQLSERHASIHSWPNSARLSESSASCFSTAEANVHGFSQSRNAIAALMRSDLAILKKRTMERRQYHDRCLPSGDLKGRFGSKTALNEPWLPVGIGGRTRYGSPHQTFCVRAS